MAAESEEERLVIGSDLLRDMEAKAADPIVQSANNYLQDIIHLMRNELPKYRTQDQCLMYVKEQYDGWRAECLRILQSDFNPETQTFAQKNSEVLEALKLHTSSSSDQSTESQKAQKGCMKRFLKLKKKQAFAIGAQALDLKLPFGEIEFLRENLDMIKRELHKLEDVQVLSATNPYDRAKAGSHVKLIERKPPLPGSPAFIFLTGVLSDLDEEKEHGIRMDYIAPGTTDHKSEDILAPLYPLPSQDMTLASLYPQPLKLLFQGSFQMAKDAASVQNKWLLVNLQSTKEFSSYRAYDDKSEGRKVCTQYNLESIPVVLMINPITGQKMSSCIGMVQLQPECLLEDLLEPFLNCGPRVHHVVEETYTTKKPTDPPLPDQDPKSDNNLSNQFGPLEEPVC